MEYYDFSTDTLQDKPRTTVMFSTPFDCALKQEKPFGDWTPQDPLPSFCKAPEMLHSMRFAIYQHDIDLTKWDVSHVEFYYGLFWDTFSKRIDLSTWDADNSVKSISGEFSFRCPKLEVLDISSLTNHEVLIGWFRRAHLPQLQHLFVHDSSMADDAWEILRDAYLQHAGAREQEAKNKGDLEASQWFWNLANDNCFLRDFPDRIRDEYSPKIKIHIV